MNPNGFVLAASITSQTSMSILWHINAISLTNPMLTARKVFSSSLTISATRVELTGTTRETTAAYNATATSTLAGPTPPTTFGIVFVVNWVFPGSTGWGEEARKNAAAALSPVASRL